MEATKNYYSGFFINKHFDCPLCCASVLDRSVTRIRKKKTRAERGSLANSPNQEAAKTASVKFCMASRAACPWLASVVPLAWPSASMTITPSGRRRETRKQIGETNFRVVSLSSRPCPVSTNDHFERPRSAPQLWSRTDASP